MPMQSFATRRLTPASGLAAMLCALAGLAVPTTAQGPFVQIDSLDLSSITFPVGERIDIPTRITDDGVVFGYSTGSDFDFISPLTFGERQFWSASTSGLQLVGPRSLVTLDPIFASLPSDARQRNASNQAVGIVQGMSPESVNGWYFDGVTSRNLGLTATQVPNTDLLNNFPTQINATGSAIGYATNTTIALPVPAPLQLAWLDIAGEITALGLSGPDYIDPFVNQRKSTAVGINDSNQVIGYSTRFATGGTRASVDGWLYNPSTSSYEQIIVPGEAYISSSVFPQFITNDGTIGGFSTPNLSFSNATGAFISRNGVTQEVGLSGPNYTPAGGQGFNGISKLFDGGLTFGQTSTLRSNNRISTTGWFAQDGATTRIGPVVGPEGQQFVTSEGEESAFITKALENGLVVGFSGRVDLPDVVDPLLGDLGSSFPLRRAYLAWIQNTAMPASQPVVLGLTDAIHTGPGGEQFSSVYDISSAGIAVGSSDRYTTETVDGIEVARVVGSTGWVYNNASNELTIIPAPATSNGTVECRPLIVTSRGGVVGFYKVDAGASLAGYKPFYYSPRAGFMGLDVSSSIFSDPVTGEFPVAVSPDGTRVVIGAQLLTGDPSLLRIAIEPECDSIDFNRDSLFPDDNDLVDFLTVLAGGSCSTNNCNDIDFNNDGLFPDDNDLISFLTLLAGGNC